eukprot:15355512-Ditylum_brightwellii.AAC.1
MPSVEGREIRLFQEDGVMSLCESGQDGMNVNNFNTFDDVSGDRADYSFDIGGCPLPWKHEGARPDEKRGLQVTINSDTNTIVKVKQNHTVVDVRKRLDASITGCRNVPDYMLKVGGVILPKEEEVATFAWPIYLDGVVLVPSILFLADTTKTTEEVLTESTVRNIEDEERIILLLLLLVEIMDSVKRNDTLADFCCHQ